MGWFQLGFMAPVRTRVFPETVIVPASGWNGSRNFRSEIAMPLPSALVSAIRLSLTVMSVPP
ncbi:hypothetical protein SHIRM173S_09842 [Streptomyces hirsutus]